MDIEIKMPDIGLDEVEVIEILVQLNDKIDLEQELITVEGDKASMEIPSPISGIVKDIYVKIGDKVKTSSIIMIVNVKDIDHDINDKNIKPIKTKELFFQDNCENNTLIHATPVIRRLARNLKIDLNQVFGTGRKNRILKEDLELYYNKNKLKNTQVKENIYLNNSKKLSTEEVELSQIQKITGNNLNQNWINIPHVTQFDEANISLLEKFRKKYNSENNNKKNITILVFIIKIIACALKKFPIFNSSLNADKTKIILKKYIHIGVAVEVPKGIVVPVLKNVNKKNIEELSIELTQMLTKSRTGKLSVSDMKDGCFTISNLGGIGGGWFSPIINAPEVAILGVSKAQIKPLWDGNEFIPSLILPLSLSYDHRVINGGDAARFITFITKLLSDIHFLVM